MTKVCFLADPGNLDGTIGGAELTMREFAETAPDTVDLVPLKEAATVVIGNCVTFGPDLIDELKDKTVVRYHHDLSPHGDRHVREWLDGDASLDGNATHIFTSPLHQDRYGMEGWPNVPPAIPLGKYRPNREARRNGSRSGTVSIGSWHNEGKGQQLLREWADANTPVDVYGAGPYFPHGPNLNDRGLLDPADVASVLQMYERFVHLPTAIEPFGRGVVEAWAAGCDLVTNRNVGACWWIEENPGGLETAAQDFWGVVLGA